MAKDPKLTYLQSLSESDFRGDVLVPLFKGMGFSDVTEYHGTLEFGKDIVFSEQDRFGERIYYAVVVKHGRIHGTVGKAGNSSEVLYQAQQALGEPWLDPFNIERHRIDKVIIATSGQITQGAILSIEQRIQGQHIRFLEGNKILVFIDNYAPDIWQALTDLHTKPVEQASIREILIQVKAEKKAVDKGRHLEQLVKKLFERLHGFVDVVTNVRSSSGEIDLMFRNESSDPFWNQQGPFIMVECKSLNEKVGLAALHLFASKMSQRAGWCRLGFFISLSGFTKDFYLSLRNFIMNNVLIVPIDQKRLEKLCEVKDPKGLLKEYLFNTLNL